jgi:hypothetical protein
MQEFDAEYFALTMRKVHILLSATMDDSERFLSNYQQYNALRLEEESSSDSDSDSSTQDDKKLEKLPKINSNDSKKLGHAHKIQNFFVS